MQSKEANFIQILQDQTGFSSEAIRKVIRLLELGSSVPFIARYRKEQTGSLDEVAILQIQRSWLKLTELEKRKAYILEQISAQGKLSEPLRQSLINCFDPDVLEDLYLPYKPKRKTRAAAAIEKGLEPLAEWIYKQYHGDPEEEALKRSKLDPQEALSGAKDIIAEWISENPKSRGQLRRLFEQKAAVSATVIKGKAAAGSKYKDYFDYSENIRRIPSHRFLAVNRAEAEGILRMSIAPPGDEALHLLRRIHVHNQSISAGLVDEALVDAYKRLLQPQLETEMRQQCKKIADQKAIDVFSQNLRQLLMAPPLGQRRILAIDPGYRTGSKVVCLSASGELLAFTTIFPLTHGSESAKTLIHLCSTHSIEAIAVGNGTAGKENYDFCKDQLQQKNIPVFLVNEAGASVYSASEIARLEFPQLDIVYRGAVSIGRRLMDPLSELVKIDPGAIGVGQYQHDVHQGNLNTSLEFTVKSVVNQVGVNVNVASASLLQHVSGLGPSLAENIVQWRKEQGLFTSRAELKKVPRMGEKAFEQSAGFLRIEHATNALDSTGVHPESYFVVEKIARDYQVEVQTLIGNTALLQKVDLKKYIQGDIGLPTLTDIMHEMKNPGRDIRGELQASHYNQGLTDMQQLQEGMVLRGVVSNITQFGAFVDIGLKEAGLVHVSEMSDTFIKDPLDFVRLGQEVNVRVLLVDISRKRIQLSMKGC